MLCSSSPYIVHVLAYSVYNYYSALSFAAGLFQGQGPLNGYQPVDIASDPLENDNLLRFDEHRCPLYDKLVTRNTVSQTACYCDDQWTVKHFTVRKYRRSGFDCEILMIANCEFFRSSQSKESQNTGVQLKHILLHSAGLTIAIIRFAI